MKEHTAQSYASKHGTKYNPIAIGIVKTMAEQGLSYREAKDALRDVELLLEDVALTVKGFGDLLETS